MALENSVSNFNGMHYFSQGWKLVRLPGIRRFVVITTKRRMPGRRTSFQPWLK